MSNDLSLVMVPKDLYYHEAAYVCRLEGIALKAQELTLSLHGSAGALTDESRKLLDEFIHLSEEHLEKSNV